MHYENLQIAVTFLFQKISIWDLQKSAPRLKIYRNRWSLKVTFSRQRSSFFQVMKISSEVSSNGDSAAQFGPASEQLGVTFWDR